jgi:hypothetical protein
MLHTTPFTCQVGKASALTVGGVPGGGTVSAAAGIWSAATPKTAVLKAVTVARTALRTVGRKTETVITG